MTWNILHGGGPRRTPLIALELVEQQPDILLLTEFRVAKGSQLRAVLADHGLTHQQTSHPGPRQNGLLLASRWPIDSVNVPPPTSCAPRILEADTAGLRILGLHIPEKRGDSKRLHAWAHTINRARALADRPAVLLGDFNTGRNGSDGPRHAFDCTQRLGQLATLGYIDAWRTQNPHGVGATWHGELDRREGWTKGRRIDHAWLSAPVSQRLRAVHHDASTVAQGLSDHTSLVVELARTDAEVA
ncbi:MAG: endonuclease/exonuclease/phosphatase family protein [Planctomycetota bacterium]